MVNKQKIKGTSWERQICELIEENIPGSKVKRIAGSGALGTVMHEPSLTGDVIMELPNFEKKFRGEAKVGYGGDTQLTVKKEWFDKIKQEADNSYAFPLLLCKFLGAKKKDGVQYFVALDLNSFCDIMNYVSKL